MSGGQRVVIPSDPLLKNPALFLLQKSGRKDRQPLGPGPTGKVKENTPRRAKKKLAGQRGSRGLFRRIPPYFTGCLSERLLKVLKDKCCFTL